MSSPASRCTGRSTALGARDRPEHAGGLAGRHRGRAHPRSLTYTLSGALGGIDGALLAGYFRGANVDIGNEYLLASLAVVVIGGTSVAGGRANVPGIWGAALFLVLLLTMLKHVRGQRRRSLLVTGLVIVAVIAAAGGRSAALIPKGEPSPSACKFIGLQRHPVELTGRDRSREQSWPPRPVERAHARPAPWRQLRGLLRDVEALMFVGGLMNVLWIAALGDPGGGLG